MFHLLRHATIRCIEIQQQQKIQTIYVSLINQQHYLKVYF